MHKSKKKKQNTSSFLPKIAPLQKPAVRHGPEREPEKTSKSQLS
jgi:hypothetical protein